VGAPSAPGLRARTRAEGGQEPRARRRQPVGCDVDEELERLLGLGATRVDVGQGDVPWYVLADPEGNEFCLLARRVDQ
jgi:glyoxalase superfamily protein